MKILDVINSLAVEIESKVLNKINGEINISDNSDKCDNNAFTRK